MSQSRNIVGRYARYSADNGAVPLRRHWSTSRPVGEQSTRGKSQLVFPWPRAVRDPNHVFPTPHHVPGSDSQSRTGRTFPAAGTPTQWRTAHLQLRPPKRGEYVGRSIRVLGGIGIVCNAGKLRNASSQKSRS
eukprot:458356_1